MSRIKNISMHIIKHKTDLSKDFFQVESYTEFADQFKINIYVFPSVYMILVKYKCLFFCFFLFLFFIYEYLKR